MLQVILALFDFGNFGLGVSGVQYCGGSNLPCCVCVLVFFMFFHMKNLIFFCCLELVGVRGCLCRMVSGLGGCRGSVVSGVSWISGCPWPKFVGADFECGRGMGFLLLVADMLFFLFVDSSGMIILGVLLAFSCSAFWQDFFGGLVVF